MVSTATEQRALDWQVHLSRGEVTEGESIEVTIDTSALREIVIRGGEVTLVRKVAYRYRQVNAFGGAYTVPAHSADIVNRQILPATGRLLPGEHVVHEAAVTVPADGPASVSATLVDIQWAVTVHLDVDGGPDIDTTRTVKVWSNNPAEPLIDQEPPVVVDRGGAVLGFESLSDRRVAPGSRVSGVLTVVTDRPLSARGLRVELVLREQVHHGPWMGDDPAHNPANQDKEAETVVAAAGPAAHVEFLATQPRRFPFNITVPAQLAGPSLHTPEFTLTWVLRGVMDRRLRPDPTIEIALQAVTAPH